MMEIHEKIRLLREAKHWSQEDMAEKLNMSISGYSKIERGATKAYIPKMQKIAEVLEVELIELIPLDGGNDYLNSNYASNGNSHIVGLPNDTPFEVQKLQLINQHQQEIIAQKNKDIAHLETIIELLKNKSVS
jgi:transcriptional regulator with XRE-family HTH domain